MKHLLRKQLLLLAMVCGTTAYAQTPYEYYDRIPQIIDGQPVYDDDSHPAWITTVDSKEWTFPVGEPVAVGPNGQFRFGSSNYNDGSANSGKLWGTVTSPNFDTDGALTLELNFAASNHAGFKNKPEIGFHITYKDENGTQQSTEVTITLDLMNETYTIVPAGTAEVTHTSGTTEYIIRVPLPADYDHDGHMQMSLRAAGGLEVGAGTEGGENTIDVYGDNLVLRDDWDNTERLARNAGQKMRKVTIVRSYTKGWYTLSLPFDLTMRQFQRRFMAGFGTETGFAREQADADYDWTSNKCAEIWHYDSFDEGSERMHFRKHDANDPTLVLQAGVPYLIYVPTDISSKLIDFTGTGQYETHDGDLYDGDKVMVFTNIVLKNPEASTSLVTIGNASFASNLGATDIADVIGSNYVYYLNTDTDGENPQLYAPNSNGTRIKGFRAYFYSPKENLAKRSLFFADDDVVTAIDKVDAQPVKDAPVFNLQGQHMNNDLKNLPRGIYIVNGKKYVVK